MRELIKRYLWSERVYVKRHGCEYLHLIRYLFYNNKENPQRSEFICLIPLEKIVGANTPWAEQTVVYKYFLSNMFVRMEDPISDMMFRIGEGVKSDTRRTKTNC